LNPIDLAATKPNIIDRVVAYLSPVHGMRRQRARAMSAVASAAMGAYTGASRTRRQTAGWVALNASADAASLADIPVLRDRSRDLLRNSPLSVGAVGTVVQSVVGTGLALSSRPDTRTLGWTPEQGVEWAAKVEREWRSWAESPDCDATRTQDIYGLQTLAFRSALESGDVFALLPMRGRGAYRLQVQVVEADRVANPSPGMIDGALTDGGNRVFAGVEKDAAGAPVAYHILRHHPGGLVGFGSIRTDRYAAFGARTGRRNVLHLFDRQRPDQTRGVPYLAPVVESLHQLGQYTQAEIMAAVVSGMFTVFVKTPAGEGLSLAQSVAQDMAGTSDGAAGNGGNAPLKMGNGLIVDLADGEDVSFADPNRPNTAFDSFVQAVLRQVGSALGLPFEILVKHFTSSYSAARAALLEAWKFYSNRRHWLASGFCQPVFEAWMDEAVSLGRVSAPGYFADPSLRTAYLGCEWVGDSPGSIDPVKEAAAAEKRLEIGVSTLAEETMALTGGVWEEKHHQQVRERRMRVEGGLHNPKDTAAAVDALGLTEREREDD
jgi:lambda family phage portal protein